MCAPAGARECAGRIKLCAVPVAPPGLTVFIVACSGGSRFERSRLLALTPGSSPQPLAGAFSKSSLKADASLQLDDAPGLSTVRAPEVRVLDDRGEEAERREVEVVEGVEEVGAELDEGPL